MNQLANNLQRALKEQLRADGVSAREAAAAITVDHSLFSRLAEKRIDPSSLAKVLRYYSNRPAVHIELIRAHLWDEMVRADVDPQTFWAAVIDGDFAWFSALPPGLQGDIEVVAKEAAVSRHFALALEGMASAILRGKAEAADQEDAKQVDLTPLHSPADKSLKKPRKNAGAPTARMSFPPRSKAS